MGKWGVLGRIENSEWLLDIYTERGLLLANTFQYKIIHKFTWRRGMQDEEKELNDYVAVNKRLKSDVLREPCLRDWTTQCQRQKRNHDIRDQ